MAFVPLVGVVVTVPSESVGASSNAATALSDITMPAPELISVPAPSMPHPAPNVRAKAVDTLAEHGETDAVPDIIGMLEDPSTAVRENAAKALGELQDRSAIEPLRQTMTRPDEDEWVRLRAAESVAGLGDPSGIPVLLEIARSGDAGLARTDALKRLTSLSGLATRNRKDPTDDQSSALLQTLTQWYQQHSDALRWDPARKRYTPGASG